MCGGFLLCFYGEKDEGQRLFAAGTLSDSFLSFGASVGMDGEQSYCWATVKAKTQFRTGQLVCPKLVK